MEEENASEGKKSEPAAQTTEQPKLKCGRSADACVYKSVEKLVDQMKKEIIERQNIRYPEQLTVAEIYNIVASTLAEACRRKNSLKLNDCVEADKNKKPDVTMDTFILLKQMQEDGYITEEMQAELFATLIEMKPELKQKLEEDHAKGLI
jgi:hypothetical protein